MTHDPRHKQTPDPATRASVHERDDASKPRRERRIGSAQMAAPSARTWRRAGRFQSSRQTGS